LLHFRADSFAEACEFVDQLPVYHDGRLVNAARAAVELAVLDLAGKAFQRPIADACQWLELPEFVAPGALPTVRFSGIVVGRKPLKRRALLALQRAYGLRDFKLKVAVPGWQAALADAARGLGGAIARGRATLRVDANAGWSLAEVSEAIPLLKRAGVSVLEQPLPPDQDGALASLRAAADPDLGIMADESLRTVEDAQRLIEEGGVRVLNVRIAKCGGLLPSWRIAAEALAHGLDVQLGCLVGETSLLSAAGAAFLQRCPRVRFVEGSFGRWLLRDDVIASPVQFGYRGRLRAPRGYGLGVTPDLRAIERLRSRPPVLLRL
jgi:muconate cycloisomerase